MNRVLIVEDDDIERRTLVRVLTHEGFEVQAVGSGTEALACLAAEDFDTAIIDVMMPGINGLALARMIADQHRGVGIVLTSAYHLSQSQLARLDIGPARFLDKPMQPQDLIAAMRATPPPRPATLVD